MSYPTPPGRRIPYDENGTRMLLSHTIGEDRTPYQAHPRALAALNSDVGLGLAVTKDWWGFGDQEGYYSKNYISLVFPHPMTIQGVALSLQADWGIPDGFLSEHDVFAKLTGRVQVSVDTTNGLDGTWTNVLTKDELDTHLRYNVSNYHVTSPSLYGDLFPEPPYTPDGVQLEKGMLSINEAIGSNVVGYWNISDTQDIFGVDGPLGRGIQATSGLTNVMGIRIFFPSRPALINAEPVWGTGPYFLGGIFLLHLYGDIGSSASDDRLQLRNTADSGDPDLTWGDVDQGVPEIRSFKVKNTSDTDTAEAVAVGVMPTFSPSGTAPELLGLSLDGSTWAPRLTLGDLTPGSVSDEVFIRVFPTTDTVGLRSALITAQAGRWS